MLALGATRESMREAIMVVTINNSNSYWAVTVLTVVAVVVFFLMSESLDANAAQRQCT